MKKPKNHKHRYDRCNSPKICGVGTCVQGVRIFCRCGKKKVHVHKYSPLGRVCKCGEIKP